MNERIKQLKHQASIWCDENIPEQFSDETNGYGKAWEDKFAELIVRECAELIGNKAMLTADEVYDEVLVAVYDTNFANAEMIKSHFGVKE